MLYNFLDCTEKRSIIFCNYNQHIHTVHPDRTMAEHDLVYIREGIWQISQDGIDYDLVPGDVILLQGGHHHYGLLPCASAVKTCFVHFSMHADDKVGEKVHASNCWIFPMVTHCQNNKMVEHYFKRIIYSYWSENEYNKEKALAYLNLLLCELAEVKEYNSCDSIVEDIKLQIKKTPDRFIKIEEFAEKYSFSERTISSKFKNSTGFGIHEWQMRLKCQMADELMQYEPSITLKELAATYGFYDEYHFGKSFKKTMGRSPKKSK